MGKKRDSEEKEHRMDSHNNGNPAVFTKKKLKGERGGGKDFLRKSTNGKKEGDRKIEVFAQGGKSANHERRKGEHEHRVAGKRGTRRLCVRK